jgi:hypothetical protein
MKMARWLPLFLMLVACPPAKPPAAPTPAAAVASKFRYDAATGRCVDAAGNAGLNAADPAALFVKKDEATNAYSNGDAECVDFSSFDFNEHIGMGYPNLVKWNFRGAKFEKTKFLFANMVGADFAGADLRGLSIGYANVEGRGDANTQGPLGKCEIPPSFEIVCFR